MLKLLRLRNRLLGSSQEPDPVESSPSSSPIVSSYNTNAESPVELGIMSPEEKESSKEEFAVEMENVHKTYLLGVEGVPALRGVSLNIRKGEFIVILGKSGSGKTSLLNIIGTIDQPTKGRLKICGQEISSRSSDNQLSEIRLRKLGFVFQTFNLISSMSGLDNVSLPMTLAGNFSRAKIKQRATRLLEEVGMGRRLYHKPSMLSGGEQQRVTIARAMSVSPEILLLDEPTGDLDTINSHVILKMLLDLNSKEKVTMIMVTHDVAMRNHANRVIHMLDGKIQRVEDIAPLSRQEAYEKLQRQVKVESVFKGLSMPSENDSSKTEYRDLGNAHSWLIPA